MDWGQAVKVASAGFGVVVFILGLLTLAIYYAGLIIRKAAARAAKEGGEGSKPAGQG